MVRVSALHGVDISEEMLASARRGVPGATFKCYDGKTLPFTTGSFDVVIGICVLHHVPLSEQLSFVREMDRVAAPDGLLVIFEHNPANPLTRREVRGCEFGSWCGVTDSRRRGTPALSDRMLCVRTRVFPRDSVWWAIGCLSRSAVSTVPLGRSIRCRGGGMT